MKIYHFSIDGIDKDGAKVQLCLSWQHETEEEARRDLITHTNWKGIGVRPRKVVLRSVDTSNPLDFNVRGS